MRVASSQQLSHYVTAVARVKKWTDHANKQGLPSSQQFTHQHIPATHRTSGVINCTQIHRA